MRRFVFKCLIISVLLRVVLLCVLRRRLAGAARAASEMVILINIDFYKSCFRDLWMYVFNDLFLCLNR